jgi:hypothetical protein
MGLILLDSSFLTHCAAFSFAGFCSWFQLGNLFLSTLLLLFMRTSLLLPSFYLVQHLLQSLHSCYTPGFVTSLLEFLGYLRNGLMGCEIDTHSLTLYKPTVQS